MTNSSLFSSQKMAPARHLILVLLFCSGLAVMWRIAEQITSKEVPRGPNTDQRTASTPGSQRAVLPALPPPAKPPASLGEAEKAETKMDANSSAVAAAPPKSSEDNTEIQVLSKKDRPAQTPKQISTPESSIQTHEGGAASPAQIAVSSSGVRQIATGPILFNTGLAELRPVSFNTLDEVAGLLKANRNMRLAIVGHTDNLGPEKGNVELSAARAEAVKGYLVSKGIEPSRLEFKGMGSKSPIASNDTKLGRQANRRIEFLVTSPK